jgi:peptide deformylase
MKILPDDHSSLHTPCDIPVTKEDMESREFDSTVTEMIALMRQSGGIGLAANQVGLRKRFFVAYLNKKYFACLNPQWKPVKESRAVETIEQCLSLMECKTIPRWNTIEATWNSWDGKTVKVILKGIEAQCFQHECDHLDGIPFSEMPSRKITTISQ